MAMSSCAPEATEAPAATKAPEAAPTEAPPEEEAPEPEEEAPEPEEEMPEPEEEGRILTPTYYSWWPDLHPALREVWADRVDFQIAPVEGFGIERFVAEARDKMSTWDLYGGMTPFVEMKSLIKAGVIEPWDPYIPKEVLDDIIPSIRDECSVDGKLYCWPFVLDIICQAWNTQMATDAGLDPEYAPATWDEWMDSGKSVIDSGAAEFGVTFDAHGWRSLAPITHSISSDVYEGPEGRFKFTSDEAVEALEYMKEFFALSHPDVLLEGASDGGVNGTPDEVAFAVQRVAYYIKYQNAPARMAALWPDPSQLRLSKLPAAAGGEGSSVFWDTGVALFTHGQNKEEAAEYITALSYDAKVWEQSIAGSEATHPMHIPPYKSLYDQWETENPEWIQDQGWIWPLREALDTAVAIKNHEFGLSQFQIGKPYWEKYITGEESDPKVALQEAYDAVTAEIEKVGGES
jgi:ABC-type glycerol-3-phosphate transport system substrate-binding protein